MLHIIHTRSFSCPRLCTPGIECLFGPIFHALGETRVVSHTVRVNVQLKNRDAVRDAVEVMKGTVIGQGQHYAGGILVGFGFNLPNWRYPLVLQDNNVLAFDDYNGRWGNRADIKTLTDTYTIEAARMAAMAQGWMSERLENGNLLIHHPDGPTITVQPNGVVESSGFVGQGCDVASKIEDALGQTVELTHKAEYFQEVQHIRQS